MILQPDFHIQSNGIISKEFVEKNIFSFKKAASFIQQLPYGRNLKKNNLASLFIDNCGTCSTKHALLKTLADENDFKKLKLMVGLFKMNKRNTPEIAKTLEHNKLEYIPEAHCYLKYNNIILDYTKNNSKPSNFIDDLIEEMEISPDCISDYKLNYHKNYLKKGLDKNESIKLSFDNIWEIREQCIQDLADNNV